MSQLSKLIDQFNASIAKYAGDDIKGLIESANNAANNKQWLPFGNLVGKLDQKLNQDAENKKLNGVEIIRVLDYIHSGWEKFRIELMHNKEGAEAFTIGYNESFNASSEEIAKDLDFTDRVFESIKKKK